MLMILPVTVVYGSCGPTNLVGSMERNNYKADFDAQGRLMEFYSNPSSPTDVYSNFMVTNLHQFFHSVPLAQTELKVVDYGCGPVIANVISASLYASSAVLAEYTPQSQKTKTTQVVD